MVSRTRRSMAKLRNGTARLTKDPIIQIPNERKGSMPNVPRDVPVASSSGRQASL